MDTLEISSHKVIARKLIQLLVVDIEIVGHLKEIVGPLVQLLVQGGLCQLDRAELGDYGCENGCSDHLRVMDAEPDDGALQFVGHVRSDADVGRCIVDLVG